MTEYLINERQQNEGKNIDWKTDGFLFARSVNDAMLANMSAWVHYSLKRYYGCLGDGQYGTTENAITKRGYILSQYAKYVSGNTRIRHSIDDATGKLSASAYITPSGDSVVVMVLNPSADSYQTTLTLPFYTVEGMQIVTTETENVAKQTLTPDAETYQPQVSVAAYSVNTYIFVRSSDRTDLPTDDPAAVSIWSDNFASYGASCVPPGWRAKSEGGTRTAGNYSLGPRIMGFSPEGAMQYAFYFRTGTDASGSCSYGEETDYRLYLEPGKYTLKYATVGWKATPQVTALVQTASGSTLKSLVSTPTTFVSENGSSARITQTTDFALEFEISQAGNYLLKWVVAKSSGGLNEALVGNISLLQHPDESSILTINADDEAPAIYNLQGQLLSHPQPGINIQQGRKVILVR